MVNDLRCKGVPICSCNEGYYYADSDQDICFTIAHLNGRIKKMQAAKFFFEPSTVLYRFHSILGEDGACRYLCR